MRNDTATRKLGQLNRQQHETQTKLEVLQQYRHEYQERLQAAIKQGIEPASLRNFQEFIHKLDLAIAQQLNAVEQSKLSTQLGRGEFHTTQRNLKSFDTLQQRHTEEQIRTEAKKEQRAMDEHTGRFVAYKKHEQ